MKKKTTVPLYIACVVVLVIGLFVMSQMLLIIAPAWSVAWTWVALITDFIVIVGLAAYFGIVFDLAARVALGEFSLKQALEEVKKLRSVMDSSHDGIMLTDPHGVIRHVNPAWTRITGWTAKEAEGKLTTSILKSGQHSAEVYSSMWLTLQDGETFHGELINKRKDGGYYKVDEIIKPLFDTRGRITGYASFHRVIEQEYKGR